MSKHTEVKLYDTTLRDGTQGEGVNFSSLDKIRIAKEGDDQHRLTVVTDGSSTITKAEAVAALGKDSHYSLTSWSQGS